MSNFVHPTSQISEMSPMNQTCAKPKDSEKRLYVRTFGCQMNEYDSLRVQRMLGVEGYRLTAVIEEADVIFINTCSVREKAEQKVYSFLGRLKRLKARHPGCKIIVAGCVAQQLGNSLLERFDHLDLVLGTRAIGSLPRLLESTQSTGRRLCHLPDVDEEGWDYLFNTQINWQSGVVAPVTIMQGCNNFCTYCIVPHVRGRERSRPTQDIIMEIRRLVKSGAKEVLLLGQNVNSYGRGLAEQVNFAQLLHIIHDSTGIERIRFTTSHPKDLTTDLVSCFTEIPTLCKHIHLPFQAGSDRILKRMNRHYTAGDYLRLVESLRRVCPDIAISADVMVGFPGETDHDFRDTLRLIERVQFDSLFSFRYSDRPFTKASQFTDKVSEDIKAQRLIELQALQNEITLRKNRSEIGKVREVLVDGTSKVSREQLTGRTSQNRIVNFPGSIHLTGKLINVTIIDAYSHSLKGEMVA